MTRLPASWAGVVEGLKLAPIPDGVKPPLDLAALAAALQAGVRTPQGWDALLAHAARTPLPEIARQWQRTPTRVEQIRRKARAQLRCAAHGRAEGDVLWNWAAVPQVVDVPAQDQVWSLLVSAFPLQATPRLGLHTVQLGPGRWALYQGDAPHTFRHAALPLGAAVPGPEAAAQLTLTPALLAAVWPALGVQQLRNGRYVSALPQWSSAHWVEALLAALQDIGERAWDEHLLLTAYRALPGAPDVQDHTLRLALRRSAQVIRGPQAGLWVAVAPPARQAS
ncbi:hypothetical protein K7W42_12680 [Deinococcus sp. HMF7604]|uniref:hypothetical protein n=1 Tax=Deinococcus betulae TaxID=2873312 RepID=UPI001CD01D21|nr:hypothetical protein [Deinococcus betulae]MBZ9751718.1 hypothetical protein [Deinococcus betulae]